MNQPTKRFIPLNVGLNSLVQPEWQHNLLVFGYSGRLQRNDYPIPGQCVFARPILAQDMDNNFDIFSRLRLPYTSYRHGVVVCLFVRCSRPGLAPGGGLAPLRDFANFVVSNPNQLAYGY